MKLRRRECTRWLQRAAMAAAVVLAVALPARAEYALQPGDSLDFDFIATPNLKRKSMIGADGKVSIPLLGQVKAADMTLTDFKESLKTLMANRLMRQIGPDGKENMILLSPDDIFVSVATYRPAYVQGDVAKPGEIEFKPGMSARQAISVAGGVDRLKGRVVGPLEPYEFRGQYTEALTIYLAEQARIIRIRAELDGVKPDFSALQGPAKGLVNLDPFIATEIQTYNTRVGDLSKEKAYLTEAILKADKRVGVLSEQRDREAEGEKEDVAELERVQALVQRGSAPITRVTDARRTSLFSATRVLQTATQVTFMERDRDELKRKLVKTEDDYRTLLLRELQDANMRVGTSGAQLAKAKEKLNVAGASAFDTDEVEARVTIYRNKVGMRADLDAEIQPGDVIEVKLPPSKLPSFGSKQQAANETLVR